MVSKVPVTVIIAIKNEISNLGSCLGSLQPATRVIVVDSHSNDGSIQTVKSFGFDLVQFDYKGGYPKKRQWALQTQKINTEWILLLDADEVIPIPLWLEIQKVVNDSSSPSGFLITKGFHFLGRPFRFGGFSFASVLLFRYGKGKFEQLIEENASGLDMEVHERVIIDGPIGKLSIPLVHHDFKGLHSFIDRHNRYSTWEAILRSHYLSTGVYGRDTIRGNLFGNTQERRRFLKFFLIRLSFESSLWFFYHYIVCLGFLEGRRGYIACRIRADYIENVKSKVFELQSKMHNDF